MKIAILVPSLDNKGPIVAVKNLVTSLKNYDIFIDIFYFNDINKISMDTSTYKIGFFEKFNFNEYDIINTHGAKPDLYMEFHKQTIKTPIVASMHNYMTKDMQLLYGRFKSWMYLTLWKYALKNINYYIVSSKDMQEYYQQLLSEEKSFKIIEYGVENKKQYDIAIEDERILSDLKSRYRIIGSVGLLIKRKGYSQLIEFLKTNDDYAVVIIGDGVEYDNLKNEILLNGLESRFILLGFKSNSIDYYRFFDIYAMTSYAEGCSLAMLEALAKKLPILCSDIPNHRDCFQDNEVSFFSLDEQKSLSKAIVTIENNYQNFANKSYNIYKSKFSLDSMAKKYLNFFKEIRR